jgi:hypothetical protein
MKGCILAPIRRIKSAMKVLATKVPSDGFIEVGEYKTSKVCSCCNEEALENAVDRNSKRKLYAVLKCKTCDVARNRDVNAAKNVHSIFIHQALNNNKKPTALLNHPLPPNANEIMLLHTIQSRKLFKNVFETNSNFSMFLNGSTVWVYS